MQTTPATSLVALRDVAGVLGSFVINADGSLMLKDLPAVFDDALFEELGPRLLVLGEVLGREGTPPETITLRFAEHRLHVKFLRRGAALTALSSLTVNAPTLKMAMTLTARRIEQSLPTLRPGATGDLGLEDRPSLLPPETQRSLPASGTRAAPRAAEPPTTKARVLYRGRPI